MRFAKNETREKEWRTMKRNEKRNDRNGKTERKVRNGESEREREMGGNREGK